MSRWSVTIIASIALFAAFGTFTARSQDRDDWRGEESQPSPQNITLSQGYTGVRPGTGNNLPRVEELKGKSGTWVTWPGFIVMPEGTSRVFLQTTVPIEYTRSDGNKRITLKLKHAKVHLRNNRNPLVTTHFNTPLNRAFLKKNRKSLDLVMELRQTVNPSISQTVDNDGYHYLFIDFPPGSYPKAGGGPRSYQAFGSKPSGNPAPTVDDEQP